MQISISLTDTNRYLLGIAASVVAIMLYMTASVIEYMEDRTATSTC